MILQAHTEAEVKDVSFTSFSLIIIFPPNFEPISLEETFFTRKALTFCDVSRNVFPLLLSAETKSWFFQCTLFSNMESLTPVCLWWKE